MSPEMSEQHKQDASRQAGYSPYAWFSREQWALLSNSTPITLSREDLEQLRGINESLSMDEVSEIYLPLSRLLNLHVAAMQNLHEVTDRFLKRPSQKMPYIIGLVGSVAVGKSTTARLLQALLSRWEAHPRVDLVTTDGFLYPNRVLEEQGLMKRKGFPESYDVAQLIRFLAEVKSGASPVKAPVYSHLTYDIVPGEHQVVENPDILIIEGLNLLQSGSGHQAFVSDFIDFSIYVDADEQDLRQWFIERFLLLQETAFQDQDSYFHNYAGLDDEQAVETAGRIWDEINAVNLRNNILPTRERAHLILEKGDRHRVQGVRLRKL